MIKFFDRMKSIASDFWAGQSAFIFVRMGFLLPKRRKTASAFGSMRKLTAAIGIGGESNFRYFFARIRPFAIPP